MRRYGALLVAGVTITLALGTTTAAHAAAPACSTLVTDDAGVLSPAQLAQLRKHAAGLAAKTELRIRTERSLFTGTLNGDEGSLQQDCKWASSSGVRRPRMLVIMVATESRQMGVYPGTAFVGTLIKPVWLSIEQKDMRPHFAKADWVGGLEAGVDALSAALGKAAVPPSPLASAPAASSAAAPSASAPASAAASASADGQGIIPGDGSQENPPASDPNGLSVNQGGGAITSDNGNGSAAVVVIVLVAILVMVGAVFGVARGAGSARRRGHYGPDGAWINTPFDSGSHHHNSGMFGGGGFDGGGGGGGDSGGGGSSSDGGGGSSGF